jgi:hypothetical protein
MPCPKSSSIFGAAEDVLRSDAPRAGEGLSPFDGLERWKLSSCFDALLAIPGDEGVPFDMVESGVEVDRACPCGLCLSFLPPKRAKSLLILGDEEDEGR